MTIADLVRGGVREPTTRSRSPSDECLKCNVCNTVCPVLRVTDLFPGPKYEGPQAQRFRLAGGEQSRARSRPTPPRPTTRSTTARAAAGARPRARRA